MTESSKTGIIAAIAAVSTFLAWSTTTRNYSTGSSTATDRINQPLFEKFADPLSAASLKIVKYDSDAEQYEEFEVAKDRNGVWTIPSHENYPADANKQMSEAANLFVGLKALNIASEKRDEHKMFGVLEPDKKKEAEGGDGVGELVQFRGEKGDVLADLIIGKVDATDTKKRFVRIPSEDVIYVVELNANPLSTDFKQWIESDLLKLSSNDIEGIGIRNYSLVKTGQGTLGLSQNYDADLSFNVRDGKWQPTNLLVYDGRVAKPKEMEPNEEVNAAKLNDMKSALDNLRIVNVAKKPAGVAADLRGEKLQDSTLQALQRRGFFASQTSGTDSYELYAMNGDLQVTLKDGVQYLLRFGNGAGASFEPVETEETKDGEAPKEVSINRFLLVTTRLDESKFPPPDLERVPESVEELKASEAAKKAARQPASPSGAAATEPMPTEPSAAVEPAGTEPGAEPAGAEPAAAEPANADQPKPSEGETSEGEKPSGDQPAKDPVAESVGAKTPTRFVSFQDPAPPAELSEEEWKERLEAERERITKENQRKIDQRNDRLAVAKKRVAELNARFADWYYIVSDSEFKRLKIELADLITKKGVGLPTPPATGLPGSVPGFNIPGLSDQ